MPRTRPRPGHFVVDGQTGLLSSEFSWGTASPPAEGAASYALTYGEREVYTTDTIPIDEPFTYLTLLISSLEDVTVQLFDSTGAHLLDGRFDLELQQIVAPIETQ